MCLVYILKCLDFSFWKQSCQFKKMARVEKTSSKSWPGILSRLISLSFFLLSQCGSSVKIHISCQFSLTLRKMERFVFLFSIEPIRLFYLSILCILPPKQYYKYKEKNFKACRKLNPRTRRFSHLHCGYVHRSSSTF